MSEAARPKVQEGTSPAKAYAAQSASSGLTAFTIHRRAVRPQDVQIEILFCGVCHSDLHQVRNEWQSVSHRVPLRAGPRDRRPRGEGRQRGEEIQGRATLPAWAAWWIPAAPARAARRRTRAVLRRTCRHSPTTARTNSCGGSHLRRLFRRASWWTKRSCCACRTGSTWPAWRRCCARASRPTRRCATGTSAKGRRSASWVWAGWGTWA